MKYIVTLNNKNYEVDVTQTQAVLKSVTPACIQDTVTEPEPAEAVENIKPSNIKGLPVKSPMPGNILEVRAKEGQAVKAGDILFLLEAMKMENEIVAPVSGTIKQILVEKGSVVETDAVLAVL